MPQNQKNNKPAALTDIYAPLVQKAKKKANLKPNTLVEFSSAHRKKSILDSAKDYSQETLNLLFNKFFICCKESRIESPNNFYGCFYIGPFDESLSQTLAHNMRRTLLSELSGLAITAVEIDGVSHKFSNLPGVQETVFDIICNLQNIVLKKDLNQGSSYAANLAGNFKKAQNISQKQFTGKAGSTKLNSGNNTLKGSQNSVWGNINNNNVVLNEIGYLRVRGPGVVKASDFILPTGIQCVNPDQYIATLAEDGVLNMKIFINQGKNYIKQKQKNIVGGPNFSLGHLSEIGLAKGAAVGQKDLSNTVNKSHTKSGTGSLQPSLTNRIFLDSIFMPVTKVNAMVQNNDKCTDDLLEKNLNWKFISSNVATGVSNIILNESAPKMHKELVQKEQSVKQSQALDFKFDLKSKQTDYNLSNFDIGPGCDSNELPVNTGTNKTFFTIKNTAVKPLINNMLLEGADSADKAQPLSNSLEPFVLLSELNKKQQNKQCHIVLEIWTNGSIHPREALYDCLNFLATTFMTLENVKMLGSMYKSDITYAKILEKVKNI